MVEFEVVVVSSGGKMVALIVVLIVGPFAAVEWLRVLICTTHLVQLAN